VRVSQKMLDRALGVDCVQKDPNEYTCHTPGSRHYWTIKCSPEGLFYCDCPAYNPAQYSCKHIISILIKEGIPVEVDESIVEEKRKSKRHKVDLMQGDFTGNDFPEDSLIDRRG
jgi:hypothetical protein